MSLHSWRGNEGGSSTRRLLAAFVVAVLMVAIVGPGVAVYGSEGEQQEESGADLEQLALIEGEESPDAGQAQAEEPDAEEPKAEEPAASLPAPSLEPAIIAGSPALLVQPPAGDDPNPDLVAGGVRVNAPPAGVTTYTAANVEDSKPPVPDGFSIEITAWETEAGWLMSFESNVPISRVIVKGGSNGYTEYVYDPAVYAAQSLHAPANSNGKFAGLSHVDFYFGSEDEPDINALDVYKFQDDDEDLAWDEEDEDMLEGWEFKLYAGTYGDEADDTLVDTQETDEDGHILFSDLVPGDYYVVETLRAGWTNTTSLVQPVTVTVDGEHELWFGNVPDAEDPELGDVVIHKYRDDDEDEVWDEGIEPLLSGWEFSIGGAGAPNAEVHLSAWLVKETTDGDGEIRLSDLPAGTTLTATETLKDGWTNTTPLTQSIQVVAGQTVHLWFGNVEEFLPFTELDLAIVKSVDDHTVQEGQLLTYTLTYWNTMDDESAYDYNIIDDYDERYLTIVDAAGGTVADGKIRWDFAGPLAKADGTRTITYTARVISDMPDVRTNIDNIVRIWDDKDSDPSNNQDDQRVVYDPQTDPFLPFTGGEAGLLVTIAVFTGAAGLSLRRKPKAA